MSLRPRSKKRFARGLAAAFAAVFISACTTHYGAAYIESTPPGAQVYDMEDGFYIGITPVKHVWKSDDATRKFMNLRLQKEGYKPELSTFWLNLDFGTAKGASAAAQQVQFELEPN